jgi:hypothetical protein
VRVDVARRLVVVGPAFVSWGLSAVSDGACVNGPRRTLSPGRNVLGNQLRTQLLGLGDAAVARDANLSSRVVDRDEALPG